MEHLGKEAQQIRKMKSMLNLGRIFLGALVHLFFGNNLINVCLKIRSFTEIQNQSARTENHFNHLKPMYLT